MNDSVRRGFKDRIAKQDFMRVVVVMPARNEVELISSSIASIPASVDWIFVVNDGSTDNTAEVAAATLGERGEVISTKGLGVGGAIAIGSEYALSKFNEDCIVVIMAGDGQMDGSDLSRVIEPILKGRADHVKGNRWLHSDGPKGMPLIRRFGTWWLSRLTTLASGIRVRDSQCGYTATSGKMIADWDWSKNWQGYGYPNWWLMEAGRRGFRVEEVPVKSIYGKESSGIQLPKFLFTVSCMLWLGIWKRGIDWYILSTSTNLGLKTLACSLWLGGWFTLFYSIQQPLAILVSLISFFMLAMIDRKESNRRRGTITP
jgi:dolichol-phosphate mannosyltransferase